MTYSDCGKDILELVHERNQPGVVHVDAVHRLASDTRGYLGMCIRIWIC
jgi:ubiquinone biosynthesis protein Coq4